MAMGKKFGDTAAEYYESHKDEIDIPEWARKFLLDIFECLQQWEWEHAGPVPKEMWWSMLNSPDGSEERDKTMKGE